VQSNDISAASAIEYAVLHLKVNKIIYIERNLHIAFAAQIKQKQYMIIYNGAVWIESIDDQLAALHNQSTVP
jgi:carbonic anhydrase